MPDGGLDLGLDFTNPNTLALLGMIQGFGNAALPSRMPVPFGYVLGSGAGGAMQGARAAYENRLAGANIANLNTEAALRQNTLEGLKRLQQAYGFSGGGGPLNGTTAVLRASAGPPSAPFGVPPPSMAAPGTDTTRPGWYLRNGAVPSTSDSTPSTAADIAQGAPGAPLPHEVPTPVSTGSAAPMFNISDLMEQARLASAYGLPFAGQLLDFAKSQSQQMNTTGTYLGVDGQIHTVPGATTAQANKFLAEHGYRQNADGSFAIDPNYVRGQGAVAGAEEWAKAPAQLWEKNNEPFTLSRPGAGRFVNGRLVAQNPVALEGVNPDGTPYRTFTFLPTNPNAPPPSAAGTPAPIPGGFSSGSAVLPSGRTVSEAAPAVTPQASARFLEQLHGTGAGGGVGVNAQGLPVVQTGLNPLQKSSLEKRGTELEDYGAQLDANATAAKQNNFLIDQMRRESASWEMGKFADHINDAKAYVSAFGHQFGLDTSGYDKTVGDFQAFNKNSMELVRAATRATSSRAAVQEMQMIQQALPSATMTRQGFGQIADQMQALNDYHVAKQQAAQLWRGQHGGTLDQFEANWNGAMSPAAFWVYRMPADQLRVVTAQLQKTPEGRAAVSRIMNEMQVAKTAGLLPDLGYGPSVQ